MAFPELGCPKKTTLRGPSLAEDTANTSASFEPHRAATGDGPVISFLEPLSVSDGMLILSASTLHGVIKYFYAGCLPHLLSFPSADRIRFSRIVTKIFLGAFESPSRASVHSNNPFENFSSAVVTTALLPNRAARQRYIWASTATFPPFEVFKANKDLPLTSYLNRIPGSEPPLLWSRGHVLHAVPIQSVALLALLSRLLRDLSVRCSRHELSSTVTPTLILLRGVPRLLCAYVGPTYLILPS